MVGGQPKCVPCVIDLPDGWSLQADEMDACAHRENTRIIRSLLTGPCQVMCFSATYTADSVKDIEINVFKVGRCWSCKCNS